MQSTQVQPSAAERFMMLYHAITRPIWYIVASNALQVLVASGTITTVTTLTNQTQLGSVDAKTSYVDVQMRNNWNNAVRRNIS